MRYIFSVLLLFSVCAAAELKLGKPLTLKEPVTVTALMAAPDPWVGKTVQVKGKVTEVCQMMGCWMNLADESSGKSIRIKVDDGDIVFPKDAAGKMAIAEGTLAKTALTREQVVAQAKHEAEEQGRKFDPKSVKGAITTYQLSGSGAVLLSE